MVNEGNPNNIEDLNNYLLRAISAYDSSPDGRHFDVPMDDRIVDLPVTLRQLRILKSSVELLLEMRKNEQ